MNNETYVSIPQPCHENWDAMTTQDKGRFCASCAKTVVDFSQMSDTQVLNFLSQSKGRLCGRFAQDQLERQLVPVKTDRKKIWWMVVLMPLALLFNKANAQSKTGKKLSNIEYNKCERSMGLVAVGTHQTSDTGHGISNKVITGTIVDNKNNPIAGASILLKGTTIGTTSDYMGNFQLYLPANDSSAKFTVTAVGYEAKEFHSAFNDTSKANIEIKLLQLTPAMMGDVVVVAGYAVRRRPIKRIDTIQTTVRKILNTNPFKAYPNPANRGTAIHIEVKNEGHYTIQLLDANSKLITYSLFDAVKGALITSIIIPSSVASGLYYISLVNENTKQQYTDKIIVQ
jgi:hypothetical protein